MASTGETTTVNKGELTVIVDALKMCGINSLVVVPASGLNYLYKHFETHGQCIYATREEEAVAIACGLTLGGVKSCVVMAQAGVGNSLNAVFTLAEAYKIFFPIIVCFRGEDDPNIVQRVSYHHTRTVLESLGSIPITWSAPAAKDTFKSYIENKYRWITCAS